MKKCFEYSPVKLLTKDGGGERLSFSCSVTKSVIKQNVFSAKFCPQWNITNFNLDFSLEHLRWLPQKCLILSSVELNARYTSPFPYPTEFFFFTPTKGAFHLSELTRLTIPDFMRISLSIKLSGQISQILNSMHEGDGVSTKTLGKKHFSLSKWLVRLWSGRPVLTFGKRPKSLNGQSFGRTLTS